MDADLEVFNTSVLLRWIKLQSLQCAMHVQADLVLITRQNNQPEMKI